MLSSDSAGCEHDKFQQLPFLRFDASAQGLFDEWRANLERRLREGELSTMMESHLSKYRKLVPALTLIGHLADGAGPIGEKSLRNSLEFASYLETHAHRVYAAGSEAETATAKSILKRIRQGEIQDGFTARDIQQKGWSNLTDRDRVQAGLNLLLDLDWLKSVRVETGGRPKIQYYVSPRGLI